MGLFRAMYNTPLGFKFSDFEAGGMGEAMDVARGRAVFGLVEVMWVRGLGGDGGRDERAEERGGEPPRPAEDGLDPGVVPAREQHERRGHGDRAGFPTFVREGHLLLVGQPHQVKVLHLGKHACLVRGDFDVERLRTTEEVSAFAGMLADPQEVPEQVGGDGLHGDHHQGRDGR